MNLFIKTPLIVVHKVYPFPLVISIIKFEQGRKDRDQYLFLYRFKIWFYTEVWYFVSLFLIILNVDRPSKFICQIRSFKLMKNTLESLTNVMSTWSRCEHHLVSMFVRVEVKLTIFRVTLFPPFLRKNLSPRFQSPHYLRFLTVQLELVSLTKKESPYEINRMVYYFCKDNTINF